MRVRAGAHGTTLGPGTGQSRHRPRPEPSPLPIPDIDLVRRIGRGGFGEAWLGVNRATGGLKAVKIVPLAHGGRTADVLFTLMDPADDVSGRPASTDPAYRPSAEP